MPAKTHSDLIQILEKKDYEAMRECFAVEEIECDIPDHAAFCLIPLIDIARRKLSYVVGSCKLCFDTPEVQKHSRDGTEILIAVARRTQAFSELHELAEHTRIFQPKPKPLERS